MATLGSIFWILSSLLKFDALLDTSTNTRQLSAVPCLLSTNLTDLANMNNSLNIVLGNVFDISAYIIFLIQTDEPADGPGSSMAHFQQCNKIGFVDVLSTNLSLSADFGPSELLSVLDSGITVNFLPLWCEPLVLGHLWNLLRDIIRINVQK